MSCAVCYNDLRCVYNLKVQCSHSCVAALQKRLRVPQQQPVIWIHHIRLPLGHDGSLRFLLFLLLVFVLLFVWAVEGLLPTASLLQQRLLQRQWGLDSVLGNKHTRTGTSLAWKVVFGSLKSQQKSPDGNFLLNIFVKKQQHYYTLSLDLLTLDKFVTQNVSTNLSLQASGITMTTMFNIVWKMPQFAASCLWENKSTGGSEKLINTEKRITKLATEKEGNNERMISISTSAQAQWRSWKNIINPIKQQLCC